MRSSRRISLVGGFGFEQIELMSYAPREVDHIRELRPDIVTALSETNHSVGSPSGHPALAMRVPTSQLQGMAVRHKFGPCSVTN
jgi:hypothetical protein